MHSPKASARKLLATVAALVLVGFLPACASLGPNPSDPNAERDSRSADMIYNRVGVCLFNAGDKPVVVTWDDSTLNSNWDWMTDRTVTLNNRDRTCGFANYKFMEAGYGVAFTLDPRNFNNRTVEYYVHNESSFTFGSRNPAFHEILNANEPKSFPLEGCANSIMTDGIVHQSKNNFYQFDVILNCTGGWY